MKNSDLRDFAAPAVKETGFAAMAVQGLVVFALGGAAILAFMRPDIVSGTWASLTRGSGSAQVAVGAPPPVKSTVPSMPDAKQISGTISMLGGVNAAGMSALGMQDVMMGRVKDPAKAKAIVEEHSRNIRALEKDASKILGIPDLDSFDLADETPVGAEMLAACVKLTGEQQSLIFKKPAAIARFTNCYMTTKPARLCDPAQKKVLIEVIGWYGAAQKFWKLEAEGKAGITFTNAPKPGDWDNLDRKVFPATITALARQGYIAASDWGWFPPPEIKAMLEGVKAERDPCAPVKT